MGKTVGGGSQKLRHRPDHNKRKRESFMKRYGRSSAEFTIYKRELREKGEGSRIAAIRERAWRKAFNIFKKEPLGTN